MNSNLSTCESASPRRSKVLGLALVSILAVVLVGAGGLLASASASNNYNNVQVLIQTSQSHTYSYTITAYNTSGYQVVYYQSNYAAAAFELPAGTYLFTATASYNPPYNPCNYVCLPGASSTNTTGAKSSQIIVPSNEYGYALEKIVGPSSITINTQNATAFPTSQVTVHVAYANGTAAQGAYVYASVVGNYYYYGSNIVSNAQTGADGSAVLTMPQGPLQVTSDLSLPITMPQTQSYFTTTVGGQKVNVTLYWQPNNIYLQGQTLILPPQTSGNITLLYRPQQYPYPIYYGGVANSGVPSPSYTVTATVASSTASASQGAPQGKIAPFNPTNAQVANPISSQVPTTTDGLSLLLVGGAAALAVVMAALTLVLVAVRGRRKPASVSA